MNCPRCGIPAAPGQPNCGGCGTALMGGYGYGAGGYAPPSYIYQSRGTTILVLGILSLVVCSLLGPVAWSMGNEENRRIALGQAPPDNNVAAGRICGMIASILLILSACFLVFVFAAAPH